jgi:threonine/homoserine efflux transporter RhtA
MRVLSDNEIMQINGGNPGLTITYILTSADVHGFWSIAAGTVIGAICLFPLIITKDWIVSKEWTVPVEWVVRALAAATLGSVAGYAVAKVVQKD